MSLQIRLQNRLQIRLQIRLQEHKDASAALPGFVRKYELPRV